MRANHYLDHLNIVVCPPPGRPLHRGDESPIWPLTHNRVLYTKPRNPQSIHEIHGLHGLSMDYPVNSKGNMVGGNHTQIY